MIKAIGITDVDLAGMSPEKRQAMDGAVKEKTAELIKQKQDKIVGGIAEVSV